MTRLVSFLGRMKIRYYLLFLVLLLIAVSGLLYRKGYRISYGRNYHEGVTFYRAFSKLWDGYENRMTVIKEITKFNHNGVTLRIRDNGKVCISYFPLPYYQALSIMYGDDYIDKFEDHFVCFWQKLNGDEAERLTADQSLAFQLSAKGDTFLPVFFEGVRFCGFKNCIWIYRLAKPRSRGFLKKEQVIEFAKKAFLQTVVQNISLSGKQPPQVKVVQEALQNSADATSFFEGEVTPVKEGVVGNFHENSTGIILFYNGGVGMFDDRLDLDSLVEDGAVVSSGQKGIFAMPFRICGVPFNYIRGFTTYEHAESQVVYIQFLDERECIKVL